MDGLSWQAANRCDEPLPLRDSYDALPHLFTTDTDNSQDTWVHCLGGGGRHSPSPGPAYWCFAAAAHSMVLDWVTQPHSRAILGEVGPLRYSKDISVERLWIKMSGRMWPPAVCPTPNARSCVSAISYSRPTVIAHCFGFCDSATCLCIEANHTHHHRYIFETLTFHSITQATHSYRDSQDSSRQSIQTSREST